MTAALVAEVTASRALERAVHWATKRLLAWDDSLAREHRDGVSLAEERARGILGSIVLGATGAEAADSALLLLVSDGAVRRALGRGLERIWNAVGDGWCELALEALVTGVDVEVEVSAEDAYGDDGAIARACAAHRGLIETRRRPKLVGPQRWKVWMRPWGTC